MQHFKTRTRATESRELAAQLIMNAAFVAYETQKAKAQTAWLAADEKRRIIYVFDTDVVKTWCAPWLTGPIDPVSFGNGYGQVLPPQIIAESDDNKKQRIFATERAQAEAVAWLLASRAVGASFRRGMPILMAEAHFEETLRVYERVKRLAEAYSDVNPRSVDSRLDFQLNAVLRVIKSNLDSENAGPFGVKNAGAVIGAILRRVDIRDTMRSHGAVREWDAFRDIVRIGNGLFKLSEYLPDDSVLDEAASEAWQDVRGALAGEESGTNINRIEQEILPVINSFKSKTSRPTQPTDASAIAQIFYLNHQLRERDSNLRIVFVTGDRGLTLSMSNSVDMTLLNSKIRLRKFAFDYVHHLWSFVDAVEGDPSENNKPQELFSGLLAFDDERKNDEEFRSFLLENAINPDRRYANKIHEEEVKNAYERWNNYTRGAADVQRHYLFDPRKQEEISKVILSKLRNENPSINRANLLAIVRETTARARDRANVEFSGIGANTLLDQHRNGIRNPPELMFDTLLFTNKIFRDLALPERVFLTADDFGKRFHEIVFDCYQPNSDKESDDKEADDDFRQECYLKYLVLGALFASANRWIVAEQLAENATKIIERAKALSDPIRVMRGSDSGPRPHISGREGYFLLASSRRVRAQTEKEFAEALNTLKRARQCLEEDRKNGSGLGVPFIRFDCEELGIALAQYYSARERASREAGERTEYDPCDNFVEKVYVCTDKLLAAREKLREADAQPELPKGDRLSFLPAGTITSIATNLIQVYVISEFRKERDYQSKSINPIDVQLVKESIGILLEKTNLRSKLGECGFDVTEHSASSNATVICSSLMLLYAVVGDFISGSLRLSCFKSAEDVDNLFKHYKKSLTHYDDWRYEELCKFAKKVAEKNQSL